MTRTVTGLGAAALALTLSFQPPLASADTGPPDAEPLADLVDAAAARLQTADPVAAVKWLTAGSINDPVRVQQVLAAVSTDAESAGVPGDYATTVFADQIDATEAIQYSRFSSWKLDPSAAPSSAPDLSASRAQIDALNRRMVSEIAEQWTVLRSPECRVRLDAAKSAVAADRQLDPLYRQALDTATRSYC